MALPYSRNESHGAHSPIKGTTIDAIQDSIVGAKRNVMRRTFGPFGGTPLITAAPAGMAGTQGLGAGVNYIHSTAAANFMVFFPMERGDRVLGIRPRAYGDGAVDCTYTAGYIDNAQTLQQLGTITDTNHPAAWADVDIVPWFNYVLTDDDVLACWVAINAANYRIGKWIVTYDRP